MYEHPDTMRQLVNERVQNRRKEAARHRNRPHRRTRGLLRPWFALVTRA
jgi:hypothetical protein